ncbi:MAG: N-acetylmuramoyl-L-alanine amidase [Oscillospiraceae bacterium]|nr:N-acetylmuramoyl-L-alanine amidase [Oscillospiraceae bacterium]
MVIRFQLHKFCIFLGAVICMYSLLSISYQYTQEAFNSYHKSSVPLIIDPGHGGADGGAVGIDGVLESEINLEIALKLNCLGKLCGVPTILTRESENINYPSEADSIAERKVADQKARLRLIRDYPNAILYSIHQNTFPDEKVTGVQVLFGHDESSRALGLNLQKQFNESLGPNVSRSAAEISESIYLMKHCGCTAVLVECGFISNAKECELLQQQSYQNKLVVVLLGTYMDYINQ